MNTEYVDIVDAYFSLTSYVYEYLFRAGSDYKPEANNKKWALPILVAPVYVLNEII